MSRETKLEIAIATAHGRFEAVADMATEYLMKIDPERFGGLRAQFEQGVADLDAARMEYWGPAPDAPPLFGGAMKPCELSGDPS